MRGTVGIGGQNAPDDVRQVQAGLNRFANKLGFLPLVVDGRVGHNTDDAIRRLQRAQGMPFPDGVVTPTGKIAQALGLVQPGVANGSTASLSGAAWWHANQARWPNESRVDALAEPFRSDVRKFLAALAAAKATVTVNATTRSMTRAKIMRYCWDIAHGLIAPEAAPAIDGVAINWVHETVEKSRNAARDMVKLFAIKKQPSLNSNHLRGTAIDMTIAWTGDLKIKQANGTEVTINTLPRNGTNAKLHDVGATYKVLHKLPDDPPHWSVTGR
ncbi:MAG: peptidoglycan-binding domain-containing protein [Novosphingobium sp.]|nr:peptidoglycan-binding domain-containing protein [Novosphingobium sp.]